MRNNYARMTKAELIKALHAAEQRARTPAPKTAMVPYDRLVHDLQVHQEELEAQNQALREAQQLLEESRSRYAELYDLAPLGYVTLDGEGLIQEINLTGAAMLGLERSRLIGSPFSRWVANEDKSVFREHLRRCEAEADPRVAELHLHRKDGSTLYVELHSVPIQDAARKTRGCLTALTDIAERKRMEQAVHESEAHYRRLFDTMLSGVVYQDGNGTIVSMNPSAERILGKTRAELLGETSVSVEHDSLREDGSPFPGMEHPSMVSLRTGNQVRDVGMRVFNPREQQYRWINITAVPLFREGDNTPYQVYTLFDDITDRKQVEAALRESEARYRTLFTNMTEGFALGEALFADDGTSCDYRFLEINDAFERQTGLKREDIVGKLITEALPNVEKIWIDTYCGVAETGEPVRFDSFNRNTNRHYEVFCYRPSPGRFAVIFRDITDQRLAEERIGMLNRDLERRATELAMANQELESFSYSVSHDLRTPLASIDGFARVVLQDYGPQLPTGAQRFLSLIHENAVAMNRLIDDLLTFSSMIRQPLKKQAAATGDLVREALAKLSSSQSDHSVEIVIGDLPPCQADPVLLTQVWVNLLSNALKFTSKCSNARIEIGSSSAENETVFFVKDNGVGFDKEQAGRLFGVFQRLHAEEDYPGTGVGLAIAERIVRRHGGRIWAEGHVGQGASFYFTLAGGGG